MEESLERPAAAATSGIVEEMAAITFGNLAAVRLPRAARKVGNEGGRERGRT